MTKLIIHVLLGIVLFSLDSYAQGQVLRPSKAQKQTEKKAASNVKISDPDGYINGHGYVDLDLPSGIKWATCNVGSSKPSDYGNYYAWGETKPKTTGDTFSNKVHTYDTLKSIGIINANNVLSPVYDVAHIHWKGNWRMPEKSNFEELKDKCEWECLCFNGHMGYKVIGPNGKSIFLPATGVYCESLAEVDKTGAYWSSTCGDKDLGAYMLDLGCDKDSRLRYIYVGWRFRNGGYSVRPIAE